MYTLVETNNIDNNSKNRILNIIHDIDNHYSEYTIHKSFYEIALELKIDFISNTDDPDLFGRFMASKGGYEIQIFTENIMNNYPNSYSKELISTILHEYGHAYLFHNMYKYSDEDFCKYIETIAKRCI